MVLGVFLLHSPAVMTAATHVSDAMNSMELDMEMMRVDDDNDKVRGPPHNAPAALTARHSGCSGRSHRCRPVSAAVVLPYRAG